MCFAKQPPSLIHLPQAALDHSALDLQPCGTRPLASCALLSIQASARTVPLPQAALDYSALDLQPFYAGALVRFEGDFHRVADPLRRA